MQLEDGKGHDQQNGFSLKQVKVPDTNSNTERKTIQEALEEPFESVNSRVNTVSYQVLL